MNRREFLKNSTAAGGSLLLAHVAMAEAADPNQNAGEPSSARTGRPLSNQDSDSQLVQSRLLGLTLAHDGEAQRPVSIERYGISFLKGVLNIPADAPARIDMGGRIRRIFLLGMTESAKISGWSDPYD